MPVCPVLDLETVDAPELALVVGHESQAQRQRVSGDRGIQRADGSSGPLQGCSDASVDRRNGVVVGGYPQGSHELRQGKTIPPRMAALGGTVLQFAERDGRHAWIIRPEPVDLAQCPLVAAADEVHARVDVQHEPHQRPFLRCGSG
jgi:hypothetical protein